MQRLTLATAIGAAVATLAAAPAAAGVIGSLANFDVINDTGKPAYGFEIEIEDPLFDHTKITSVFGYDRNFGLPAGPGAVERYGVPTIVDLPTGVLIKYGGVLGGISTPSGPYSTSGDSCWPFGAGWSTATSCDHFGVSTLGQPALTKYSWTVESALVPGTLVQQVAGLPAVNFAYTPPVGGQAAVVAAVIHAEAPDHEQPENEGLWGEAFWVKTFTKNVNHNIDLGNLFRKDADQPGDAEVETEWEIFQKAPLGEQGGNDMKERQLALGDNDKAVIRRYEFYKYLGPFTAEGEADCNKGCEKDPVGLNYVGAFVGQQMAGFNVDDLQAPIALPVPEPQTWAMLLAGLAFVGAVSGRRRSGEARRAR